MINFFNLLSSDGVLDSIQTLVLENADLGLNAEIMRVIEPIEFGSLSATKFGSGNVKDKARPTIYKGELYVKNWTGKHRHDIFYSNEVTSDAFENQGYINQLVSRHYIVSLLKAINHISLKLSVSDKSMIEPGDIKFGNLLLTDTSGAKVEVSIDQAKLQKSRSIQNNMKAAYRIKLKKLVRFDNGFNVSDPNLRVEMSVLEVNPCKPISISIDEFVAVDGQYNPLMNISSINAPGSVIDSIEAKYVEFTLKAGKGTSNTELQKIYQSLSSKIGAVKLFCWNSGKSISIRLVNKSIFWHKSDDTFAKVVFDMGSVGYLNPEELSVFSELEIDNSLGIDVVEAKIHFNEDIVEIRNIQAESTLDLESLNTDMSIHSDSLISITYLNQDNEQNETYVEYELQELTKMIENCISGDFDQKSPIHQVQRVNGLTKNQLISYYK